MTPVIGVFRMMRYRVRHPWNIKRLLLGGNAALADIDLDAGRLTPFLAELIAESHAATPGVERDGTHQKRYRTCDGSSLSALLR
ncbi:MAG: hypothetical protein ACLQLT_09650 [Methylovirgula sp.]